MAIYELKPMQEEPAPRPGLHFSPYREFSREEWARLRADTPMTLVERDLEQLSGLMDGLSLDEVEQIYLPMSRLLNLYVMAAQELHSVSSRFLNRKDHKVPFIVGVAGSVAVGKSTTARVLRALLARWPDHPRVDLVTTDGFLLPNAELERRGLMNRKGFPESFDTTKLLNFLGDVKSGVETAAAPVYSHFQYDILPSQMVTVERPDILIVEGLNVLQPARLPKGGDAVPFVSDFFDFSIYIDADPKVIEEWYVARFLEAQGHRVSRSRRLFSSLCEPDPGRGGGACAGDLALDQPEEPRGEHPADAAPGAARPAQGARSPGRNRSRCASYRSNKKTAAFPGRPSRSFALGWQIQ